MDELVRQLKVVLGSTFAFYLKAHNFHWNVEGPNFPQYHEFLGDLYEEVFDAVDPLAENIRKLGAYTPGSFTRFQELSVIEDEVKIPTADVMMSKLLEDNQRLIQVIESAYEVAEQEHEHGLSNFLAERIDAHRKHAWMLRSILKNK